MQEQVLLEFIIKDRWEQGQTQSGPGSPPRRASQRTPNLISFTGQSMEEAKSGKDFFFFPFQNVKDADKHKGIRNNIKP